MGIATLNQLPADVTERIRRELLPGIKVGAESPPLFRILDIVNRADQVFKKLGVNPPVAINVIDDENFGLSPESLKINPALKSVIPADVATTVVEDMQDPAIPGRTAALRAVAEGKLTLTGRNLRRLEENEKNLPFFENFVTILEKQFAQIPVPLNQLPKSDQDRFKAAAIDNALGEIAGPSTLLIVGGVVAGIAAITGLAAALGAFRSSR